MKKLYLIILPILLFIASSIVLTGCGINVNKGNVDVQIGFNLTELEYNGKNQIPLVAVFKINNENVSSKDYEISAVNNKYVGNAKATIKLKGKYSGTITKEFKIVPKKLKIEGISFKTKKYEEGNRTVEFSSSFNPTLKGVVPGEDVILNSSNATAKIKSANVSVGNKEVVCSGFTIEGSDISNYELVQPTGTITINKASQEKPVLGTDFSIETYSNKIIINNLKNDSNLLFSVTESNGTMNYISSNIFTGLKENTTYSVHVKRKEIPNYSSSSPTYVSVVTPKSEVVLEPIEVNDILFGKGDLKLENSNNKFALSGFLSDASLNQRNYFNNNSYDYFIPLTFKMSYKSDDNKTKINNVTFTVEDGVANVTKSITLDDEYSFQLIKGVNASMVEKGQFKIFVTWGNSDPTEYIFDISKLGLPTLVRASSCELSNVEFNSSQISIKKSLVINEFNIVGNLSKMDITQENAFNDEKYDYFVTMYFENANINWDVATMVVNENGSDVKTVSLKSAQDTQYGFYLIKGLKLNQKSFTIKINWDGFELVSYDFYLNDVVYESLRWVNQSNSLSINSCEFYNSSLSINRTNEFNKYSVVGSNKLSTEQKEILNVSDENFMVLFFENNEPNYSKINVKINGVDNAVESKYQRLNGFYVLLTYSEVEDIEIIISWNENIQETVKFVFN